MFQNYFTMKKLLTLFAFALAVMGSSCSKFDDSAIWDKLNEQEQTLNDHEKRIAALEELCKQMNTNINALQTLVEALEKRDYITNVSPVREDGVVVGYTISFASSDTITIYNGKDGSDGTGGYTPQIGVKKDADGLYYWTLDGEWLLDDNGNKIKAVGEDGRDGLDGTDGRDGVDGANGQDGKDGEDGTDGRDGVDGTNGVDGITPRLKIENDYWYVSYDEGATWSELGRATGEDGDSFFTSVLEYDDKVTFVLSDGTLIDIPKHIVQELDIVFESTNDIFCEPGAETVIKFDVVGGDIAQIYAIGENGWTGKVEMNNESKTGQIVVYAPTVSVSGKILVFATDIYGHVIMKALTFTDKLLEIPTLSFSVPKTGGNIEVEVLTNLDYVINISSDALSWVSHISTRAVRKETLCFHVSENTNTLGRTAEVKIIAEDASIVKSIIIYQEGDRYYSTGTGTESDPYIIETTGQWENFGIIVSNGNTFENTYFKLGADLDFTNISMSPVGTESQPFMGIFDGNGCSISGMSSQTNYSGLFGVVKNAWIYNLTVSGNFSNGQYMGGVAGKAISSTIDNCQSSINISSGSYLGGIVGFADDCIISNCAHTNNTIGNTSSSYVGGIVGKTSSETDIYNCSNAGRIYGYDCFGGIVGYHDCDCTITNCYNKAAFKDMYYVSTGGGIVGYNCGSIINCYSSGSMTCKTINGDMGVKMCGGVVGYNHPDSYCYCCYFLQQTPINNGLSYVGDLNWGSCSKCGSFDGSGVLSSSSLSYKGNTSYLRTSMNQWVSANQIGDNKKYKSWRTDQSWPDFDE